VATKTTKPADAGSDSNRHGLFGCSERHRAVSNAVTGIMRFREADYAAGMAIAMSGWPVNV
jgi:hypothetical protein